LATTGIELTGHKLRTLSVEVNSMTGPMLPAAIWHRHSGVLQVLAILQAKIQGPGRAEGGGRSERLCPPQTQRRELARSYDSQAVLLCLFS